MKDYLVKAGDVFGVEERLREIDPGYRIMYNLKEKRFEIHNVAQKNPRETLALVVPYKEIDARLIPLVRKTRVENAKSYLREIDEENEKLEKKVQEDAAERQRAAAREKLINLKSRLRG